MNQSELKPLTPPEAFQLLQDDPRAVLIDVRSTMEYLFVGHAKGAVQVSWLDEPDWTINPQFVTRVRELLLGGAIADDEAGPAPIVLICRSGKRAKDAGHALIDSGLKNVSYVSEGFEGDLNKEHQRGKVGGWRFHGLPWEQC